jgi:uroporphyrinogen-III synthase
MTIFITRNLKPNSLLLKWGEETDNVVTGRSLLRFEPVSFIPPTAADWWFFYSARAVEFGLGGVGELPAGVRLAAIGPGTAKALLAAAGRVDFCGDGDPERVAEEFAKVATGQRVFFPRARQSRLSVQTALADRVTALDAVCYDNVAVPATEPVVADVFIFTSPLNVGAYLNHQALPAGARVLAIGPSTGAALRERGVETEWPEEVSEAGLLGLL